MKIKKLLFAFLMFTVVSSTAYAQDKKTIGFACGYGGMPTESVLMMEGFLYKMNFDTIRNSINSIEPSIQFLSSIIIERLDKEGLIKLTKNEKEEIEKISLSEKFVEVCSGCTYWKHFKIVDIYNQKDPLKFKRQTINWVDEILKEIN
jgi:hypothetical protein